MNERITWPQSGKYLLAVSGGVDSVVMLDVFSAAAKNRGYELVVAHFDHAMRTDSKTDAEFVRALAEKYGYEFLLGVATFQLKSEADARHARYEFLNNTAKENHTDAIIIAHHQDDLIETSLLNLTRGTGRTGIVPFAGSTLLRPLINVSRNQINEYAETHGITWHEDPTNLDTTNPRNFLRHKLLDLADADWREKYLDFIDAASNENQKINEIIETTLRNSRIDSGYEFPNTVITGLSQDGLAELIVSAVRNLDPNVELDRRLIAELVTFAKTAKPASWRPIRGLLRLNIERGTIMIRKIT